MTKVVGSPENNAVQFRKSVDFHEKVDFSSMRKLVNFHDEEAG